MVSNNSSLDGGVPGYGSAKASRCDGEPLESDLGAIAESRRDGAVREIFATIAPSHADEYNPSTLPGFVYVRRRELVVLRLGARHGDLLDVGCGVGMYAGVADTLGYAYRGVDSSHEMIAEARRAHGDKDGVDFSVGRVENLDFPAGSFGVVLALGVLEYVSEQDLLVAMNELRRVLRPGGTLIMSALNRTSPVWLMRNAREAARRMGSFWSDRPYVPHAVENTFTSRRIRRLVTGSGLRLVEDYPYAFVVVPPLLYRRQPHRWSRAALRLERLRWPPLRFLSLAHLVVATAPAAECAEPRTSTSAPKADVAGQQQGHDYPLPLPR